ncbi:MAG: hypothetical protein OEX07_05335, partial [Gammaproteobacteria bacterium]|nr:hypothetical protein [Gammaproteobacteria bacterium]
MRESAVVEARVANRIIKKTRELNSRVFFMLTLFLSLLVAVSSLSQASEGNVAWLSICDQKNLPDTFLKKKNYFSPDGTTFSLLLTGKK